MIYKQEEIVIRLIEDQRWEVKRLRKEKYAVEQELQSYNALLVKKRELEIEYDREEDHLRQLQVRHYTNWGKGKDGISK